MYCVRNLYTPTPRQCYIVQKLCEQATANMALKIRIREDRIGNVTAKNVKTVVS